MSSKINVSCQDENDPAEDFVLPEDKITQPDQFDVFSDTGHRRLALDLLIDAAVTVTTQPESDNGKYEYDWLLGIENDGVVTANDCFVSVAGCDIDVTLTRGNFMTALGRDPAALLKALKGARYKLSAGNLFEGMEHCLDAHVTEQARPRLVC